MQDFYTARGEKAKHFSHSLLFSAKRSLDLCKTEAGSACFSPCCCAPSIPEMHRQKPVFLLPKQTHKSTGIIFTSTSFLHGKSTYLLLICQFYHVIMRNCLRFRLFPFLQPGRRQNDGLRSFYKQQYFCKMRRSGRTGIPHPAQTPAEGFCLSLTE